MGVKLSCAFSFIVVTSEESFARTSLRLPLLNSRLRLVRVNSALENNSVVVFRFRPSPRPSTRMAPTSAPKRSNVWLLDFPSRLRLCTMGVWTPIPRKLLTTSLAVCTKLRRGCTSRIMRTRRVSLAATFATASSTSASSEPSNHTA